MNEQKRNAGSGMNDQQQRKHAQPNQDQQQGKKAGPGENQQTRQQRGRRLDHIQINVVHETRTRTRGASAPRRLRVSCARNA